MITITISVAIILTSIILYNSLIKAKNQVDNAFGSIDIMLKKRYDLIPNLIDTVKAYVSHEKEILEKLTTLRTNYLSGKLSTDNKVKTGNEIEGELGKLNFSFENYPDLKASENFITLQKAWNEAEEQISAARRFFNTAVTDYNNKVQQFPNSILAKALGFTSKELFVITNTVERENISAANKFNNN